MPVPDEFTVFVSRLQAVGPPCMVTGATAAILYGQPRVTNDLDIVLSLEDSARPGLLAAWAESEFYVPPETVIRTEQPRASRGHLDFNHHETGCKADIHLARSDPLHAWALRLFRLILGFTLALPAIVPAASGPAVSVAAASDLIFCLEALHAEFARSEPGVTLKTSTGSSGNFYAQIRHGAPYDVFLSADLRYPRELIAAGAADASSLTLYAIGRIVIWSLRPELDLSDLGKLVRAGRVQRFAIANPAHAPYGRAAQEALEHAGAWNDVRSKLVLGENIAQTAQFVQTGNAEAGIVALSLVLAPKLTGVGRWVQIPAEHHAPLDQGVVLTRLGAANPAAGRYLLFLRSPAARAVFERYGFRLPAP